MTDLSVDLCQNYSVTMESPWLHYRYIIIALKRIQFEILVCFSENIKYDILLVGQV